jgi:hypothetical protein
MSVSVSTHPGRNARFGYRWTGAAEPPAPAAGALRSQPWASDFEALRAAYRATGGLVEGDDLGRILEDRRSGDCVSLARLIMSRAVFGFQWHGLFWVPTFQFDRHDLSTRTSTRRIVEELMPPYDGWEMAAWFVQPNPWLNGRRPLDGIDSDAGQVLKAASVERFVATG